MTFNPELHIVLSKNIFCPEIVSSNVLCTTVLSFAFVFNALVTTYDEKSPLTVRLLRIVSPLTDKFWSSTTEFSNVLVPYIDWSEYRSTACESPELPDELDDELNVEFFKFEFIW